MKPDDDSQAEKLEVEIGPIWRALMRNKTAYLLIALQIAVTMAIMVNSISIIQERSRLMARPSGVDEDNIFYLSSQGITPDFDERTAVREDLDALRNLPGVVDATYTNTVPLRGGGWGSGVQTEPGEGIEGIGSAIYWVDEHGVDTFGLELVAGRNFTVNDVTWHEGTSQQWPPVAIITRALAEALFPDDPPEQAVGRTVYLSATQPVQIVGVMARMQAAWSSWEGIERSTIVPAYREGGGYYVVRTEPGRRDELMPAVEKMLAEGNRERLIDDMLTMTETRERSYLEASAMIKLLTFVVSLLTAITGLGIVGLASFSVARRTKQIGTRRALGATRPAILRYFMIENFLVSGVGVLAGGVLAVALNVWLVETFEVTRMAWYIVPVAMTILWAVGQLAVYGPARRASLVPPAVATRAV